MTGQPQQGCNVSYCGIQTGTCAFLPDKEECPAIKQIVQSERDMVLDELIQNVSERIKELKEMRAKGVYDDCAILALVGENQAMWAQLKELRQKAGG